MSDVIYNISSGFFDSVNGDRLYSAADMNKPYKRVIADGIFPTPQGTPSTDFQVVAVSGMSVAVLAGNAMIGSRWAENTDDVGITIAGNSSSSPRIDSIFLHIDTGMDTRAAGVVYRQGTAAGTPTAPAMVQTDNITELRLADILVAPSASIITQANITDQRGGSDCPWVAGLIQQVDTSALFDQYRAAYAEQQQDQANEWNTFMDHLARDYDISMSLRKHESTYTSTAAASLIPINIDGYDTTKDLLQVYINGIFAVEGTHYIVKSAAQIQLTNAISAGQKVHFVIYKAVMGGAQPIIPTDEQVQDAVDAYMDAHPGALVVDPELSDTSTHAIQNKAVTEALAGVNGRLTQLDETIYKEIVDEKSGTYSATAGSSIPSQTHLVDVSIASGAAYKFVLHADGIVSKYHLYANGAVLKYNLVPETEYDLTAASDITWISIYAPGGNVTGSGTVTGVVTQTETNTGSIEEKIETAEMSISELKNLVEADVIYFYPVYEVGANVNNSGNATYIYHEFTFPVDGTQKVGILCDSIEGATAAHPIVASVKNSGGTITQRFNITAEQARDGFSFMPESNSTILLSLYPSTTGGLTTETAKFNNVCIFTSNDGTYTIKKQSVPNLYQIPSYYEEGSYITNKIETIEGLMASANGNYDAFIFCTDQHWTLNAKQSPNLMNYIYQRLNIPRMFMGGDYADGINLNALKAYRDAYPGKIYDVIGNHEYMNYLALIGESYISHNITQGDIYAYINMHMTDAVSGDFSRGYYYIDNAMQKMRYIILSVYADNGNGASAQFEAAQKTWLQNEALNLPNGYTAVIFAHFLYSINYDTGAATKASTTDDILSVVDAYSGNGEIACMIAGHTHVDGMTTTPGGIPVFVTTCDKCKPWIYNGTDMEPWITENRIEGTITEQAFDVVIINKTSKLISFVRIGAPADNGAEAKLEIRQQSY